MTTFLFLTKAQRAFVFNLSFQKVLQINLCNQSDHSIDYLFITL